MIDTIINLLTTFWQILVNNYREFTYTQEYRNLKDLFFGIEPGLAMTVICIGGIILVSKAIQSD